jgi:hypothetical protein
VFHVQIKLGFTPIEEYDLLRPATDKKKVHISEYQNWLQRTLSLQEVISKLSLESADHVM